MKYYQLNREDYIITKFTDINKLHIEKIIEFEQSLLDMQFLIESFNKEYVWDDMFDIDEVENRIKTGHILFILYYDTKPIGYVWFKELNETKCFGYNLYVTKQIDRPNISADWFYNKTTGLMLQKYESINVEIEDWNGVVLDLVENIGYKQ